MREGWPVVPENGLGQGSMKSLPRVVGIRGSGRYAVERIW